MRFLAPQGIADHRSAPVNALGYRRVMFIVEDMDENTRATPQVRRAAGRRRKAPKLRGLRTSPRDRRLTPMSPRRSHPTPVLKPPVPQ
jgi:hypothetical protein